MITYEEAKEKAIKAADKIGAVLDTAEESKTCYIFDDSKNIYDGIVPVVIVKSTGEQKPKFPYVQAMTEGDFRSIHSIEF